MRLENEFVVPRPVDEAWAVLTDVERIAPCMPGAQLTQIAGEDYHGTVRVKVGPVVAQYAGVARFRERDPAAHRAVLEAKGKERSGRGVASALVTAQLIDEGEHTRVRVDTDLTISGPLAQFGRGAIAEVSARLLAQFVERLRETVLAGSAAGPAGSAAGPTGSAAGPAEPQAAEKSSTQAAPAVSGPPEPVAAEAPPPEPVPTGARAVEPPPADLLSVAAVPILKRLLPALFVVVLLIVAVILLSG